MTVLEIVVVVVLLAVLGFAFYRLGNRGRLILLGALVIATAAFITWVSGVEVS